MSTANGNGNGSKVQIGPHTSIQAGWAWGVLVAAIGATGFIVTHFHAEPANRKAADAQMRKDFHLLVEAVREELRELRSTMKDVRRDTRDRWPATFMKLWVLEAQTINPNVKWPSVDMILKHAER